MKQFTFEELDAGVTQYTQRVGFVVLQHNSDVERYLKYTRDELQRLSPSECLEVAHLLLREAAFLQQQINRNNAKISWANSKIDCLTTGKTDKYNQYMPYDKKRLAAINDDEYLKELYDEIIKSTTQNETLAYLPTYLKHMADNLIEMSRAKRAK